MENTIYPVPELLRNVTVSADRVQIKLRFGFSHESIAKMVVFGIAIPVKQFGRFYPYAFLIGEHTLELVISGHPM